VLYGKYDSVLGRNAIFCCKQYGWSVESLTLNLEPLTNTFFAKRFHENLSDLELKLAMSLMEVSFLRERHFTFHEYFTLSNSQLTEIISTIATL
jgi:hypothetical protein